MHSTLSHTRQRISVCEHRDVFHWVLARLGEQWLLCGWTLGIGASTIQANAAVKALVRKDSGQNYQQFLDGLLTLPAGTAGANRR